MSADFGGYWEDAAEKGGLLVRALLVGGSEEGCGIPVANDFWFAGRIHRGRSLVWDMALLINSDDIEDGGAWICG